VREPPVDLLSYRSAVTSLGRWKREIIVASFFDRWHQPTHDTINDFFVTFDLGEFLDQQFDDSLAKLHCCRLREKFTKAHIESVATLNEPFEREKELIDGTCRCHPIRFGFARVQTLFDEQSAKADFLSKRLDMVVMREFGQAVANFEFRELIHPLRYPNLLIHAAMFAAILRSRFRPASALFVIERPVAPVGIGRMGDVECPIWFHTNTGVGNRIFCQQTRQF
jgi:hypothetical protein